MTCEERWQITVTGAVWGCSVYQVLLVAQQTSQQTLISSHNPLTTEHGVHMALLGCGVMFCD